MSLCTIYTVCTVHVHTCRLMECIHRLSRHGYESDEHVSKQLLSTIHIWTLLCAHTKQSIGFLLFCERQFDVQRIQLTCQSMRKKKQQQ